MACSYLSAPHFHDEQAAIDFVEARVWRDSRACPHCGVIGDSGKLKGKSTRMGVAKQEPRNSLMGVDGGVVEIDETYIGRKPGTQKRRGPGHKEMVFALVERQWKGPLSPHHRQDVRRDQGRAARQRLP